MGRFLFLVFLAVILSREWCLGQDKPNPAVPPESEGFVPTDTDTIPGPRQYVKLDSEPKPITDIAKLSIKLTRQMRWKGDLFPAGDTIQKFTVRVLLNRQGEYVRHEVVRSDHPALERAISPHLRNLRFEPATLQGKPIFVWVTIPFRWRTL